MAGSLGLKGAGAQYTRLPVFSTLQTLARHAFVLGMRDTVWLAAAMVAVGLAASLVLVRSRDLVHQRHAPAPPRAPSAALVLALIAVWAAQGGADPSASAEETARFAVARDGAWALGRARSPPVTRFP
ncbi:MAG: hypothetical protein OWU84_11275 [Firmicutes bacterium]|nr:hypothetical protein [Bacillota bacterium]